jgi:hypothetical protein
MFMLICTVVQSICKDPRTPQLAHSRSVLMHVVHDAQTQQVCVSTSRYTGADSLQLPRLQEKDLKA